MLLQTLQWFLIFSQPLFAMSLCWPFQPSPLTDPFCEVPPQWLSLCESPGPPTQATLSAGLRLKNCSTKFSGTDKPNECSPILSNCSRTHHFLGPASWLGPVPIPSYPFTILNSFFTLNIGYDLYSERTDSSGPFAMTTNTF